MPGGQNGSRCRGEEGDGIAIDMDDALPMTGGAPPVTDGGAEGQLRRQVPIPGPQASSSNPKVSFPFSLHRIGPSAGGRRQQSPYPPRTPAWATEAGAAGAEHGAAAEAAVVAGADADADAVAVGVGVAAGVAVGAHAGVAVGQPPAPPRCQAAQRRGRTPHCDGQKRSPRHRATLAGTPLPVRSTWPECGIWRRWGWAWSGTAS